LSALIDLGALFFNAGHLCFMFLPRCTERSLGFGGSALSLLTLPGKNRFFLTARAFTLPLFFS
jgi:hypothetical protein